MLLLTLGAAFRSPLNPWRSSGDSYQSFVPTIIVPEERLPSYPDPDENDDYEVDIALQELLHLSQSSLLGYQELLKLATKPELRNCFEVIIRQRSAQCNELATLLAEFDPESVKIDHADAALVDPNSSDLRILWVRAIWCYEQEHFSSFAEKLELAESKLEDAYLAAAEAVHHTDIVALFLQHATSVCGIRERLEELTYRLN